MDTTGTARRRARYHGNFNFRNNEAHIRPLWERFLISNFQMFSCSAEGD